MRIIRTYPIHAQHEHIVQQHTSQPYTNVWSYVESGYKFSCNNNDMPHFVFRAWDFTRAISLSLTHTFFLSATLCVRVCIRLTNKRASEGVVGAKMWNSIENRINRRENCNLRDEKLVIETKAFTVTHFLCHMSNVCMYQSIPTTLPILMVIIITMYWCLFVHVSFVRYKCACE